MSHADEERAMSDAPRLVRVWLWLWGLVLPVCALAIYLTSDRTPTEALLTLAVLAIVRLERNR